MNFVMSFKYINLEYCDSLKYDLSFIIILHYLVKSIVDNIPLVRGAEEQASKPIKKIDIYH